MTIKDTPLPASLIFVFDGDSELYHGVLTSIENIDQAADSCVLVCEELLPETARMKVTYSLLDASTAYLPGISLFLDEEEAKAYINGMEQ